jgi:serine/threonine-protein kinase
MAVPQHVDSQTFLSSLRQSGLVTEEQLRTVRDRLPETHRGRLIARALVDLGLLTKFQAEMLLAGRTNGFVLGQYRILEQIGQGGMGRVFKAMHQTMNRTVALKVLGPQILESERGQQMFRREMQAAARLGHPNIVTAYDANRVGDRYYLVMEFVDGPNLEELIRDNGPLPIGLACDFIRQAALGLQHAHELGMVHRDIKPANLLVHRPGGPVDKRFLVKISDFGLARLSDSEGSGPAQASLETRPNVVMGTPDYLSPEQARDLHAADPRSDLYSLGCSLYYVLTGSVPFPGGTAMEKLVRHSTEERVPVEQLRPEIPPPLAVIVRRMMAKDRTARFQTAAEVAVALSPFAVEGTTPWARQARGGGSKRNPASDPSLLDSDQPRLDTAGFDEIAALARTVTPDPSPTALSSSWMVRGRTGDWQRHRVKVAVGLAIAIVLGAIILVGVLSFLF